MVQKANHICRRLFINLLPLHKNSVIYYNLLFRYRLFLDFTLEKLLNGCNLRLMSFYFGYSKNFFFLNIFVFGPEKNIVKQSNSKIFLLNYVSTGYKDIFWFLYCAKIFYFEYRFFFLKNFVFYKFLFKNQFRKKISFLNLNDFYFFYKKIKFFFCANPCIFFFKHLGLKKNKKFKFLLLSLNLKKINKFGLKIFVKNFNFRIIPIKIYDSFFYSKLVLKKIKFFISVNRYWRHIVRCWKIIKWPRFFDFYDCITHKLKSLDKKKKYQYFFFKYVSYSYRFLTLQTLSWKKELKFFQIFFLNFFNKKNLLSFLKIDQSRFSIFFDFFWHFFFVNSKKFSKINTTNNNFLFFFKPLKVLIRLTFLQKLLFEGYYTTLLLQNRSLKLLQKLFFFKFNNFFKFYLKKNILIKFFWCFKLFNKFNNLELILGYISFKKIYYVFYKFPKLLFNEKFFFFLNFVHIYFMSLKIKQFGVLSLYICNEIGLIKKQWVNIKKIQYCIKNLNLFSLKLIGMHILISGTISGRKRSLRFHVHKLFTAPEERLDLESHYIYNQSFSKWGVLGVKLWCLF